MTTKADNPIEPRQASYPRFSTREDINLVPQVAQSGNVKGLKLLALIEGLPVAIYNMSASRHASWMSHPKW